jgi:FMN phosphatase YigB (HAD superfamily)
MAQKAVIIDLDGTLVNSPRPTAPIKDNSEIDWNAWIESAKFSPANEWCKEIVMAMALQGYAIIFLTARDGGENSRKITENWITMHMPVMHKLYMRHEHDRRPDYEMKRDVFLNEIAPYYDVLFAIDDKQANVDLFRELGIAALHCAGH